MSLTIIYFFFWLLAYGLIALFMFSTLITLSVKLYIFLSAKFPFFGGSYLNCVEFIIFMLDFDGLLFKDMGLFSIPSSRILLSLELFCIMFWIFIIFWSSRKGAFFTGTEGLNWLTFMDIEPWEVLGLLKLMLEDAEEMMPGGYCPIIWVEEFRAEFEW